ncbi:FAD-dependent monooxygenase [uncultured Ruegeria sp.]|uniref:FAD-dependent monooxygenase n=1 Tax=uncultured Ruegeria sp. TaxID=259304 RepID=UPI002604E42D|nr:FAD-dependent monooxygenase [uncultured Ruegeria sp.]
MTDVLVSGAGPSGLVLAIELARRGIDLRIIDRDTSAPTTPRAFVVKPSTFYAAEQLGVLDQIFEQGVPVQSMEQSFEGRTAALAISSDERWPWHLNLGEDDLIPILIARLESLGVLIERGLEFVRYEQNPTGVVSVLKNRAGEEERVETSWLIGCDGVHSTIRRAAGIGFEGHDSDLHWHVLDAQIEGWPYKANHGMLYLDHLVVAIYQTRSAFRIYSLSLNHCDDSWTSLHDILRDVAPGVRLGPPISDVSFQCSARLASDYRVGRVLICGDACHAMSAGSAAGMNTGIQDAMNLGWKLASVVSGHADDALLDTYESERRPAGRAMIDVGQKNDDLWSTSDPVERSKAIRHFAVNFWAYLKNGGNGYEPVMGNYAASSISVGEQPSIGPGPGTHVPGDIRLYKASGSAVFLTGALSSPYNTVLLLISDGGLEAEKLVKAAIDLVTVSYKALDLVVVAHSTEGAAAHRALDFNENSLLIDPELNCHNRLGIAVRSALWIRPDGRIGSRNDDVDDITLLTNQLGAVFPGLLQSPTLS